VTGVLTPPRIKPPARAPTGLRFMAAFVKNPLDVIPQAAYEADFVAVGRTRAWVTSPALVKAVLLDERDKFRKLTQIRLLGPLLGKGILTSEGADWKWQRQAAAPMFRPQGLGHFVPAFVRAAEDALARWRAAPGEHDIDADMTRATFDVICATLLPSADAAFARHMQQSIRALQRNGGWDMLYAALKLPGWFPRPGLVAGYEAMRELRGEVARLLRSQRGHAGSDDLLQRLVAARDPETGRGMDDEQLVDNLLTFYLAGHDTTARALTWTLYLLARSPEWMQRVADEVRTVTGGAPIAAGHVERLQLTQQVLKESMRLYPPVPIMSRQAIAAATIEGLAIEPGMSVLMPIYAIHRHAKRWQRPDVFDPARFEPRCEEAMPRYQYMPFGAGPRVCIGMAFALMEATTILATLVRHARFEPVGAGDPVPVARVTLIPKHGLRLKVAA
jgi:cytochrome P450